MDGRIPKHMQQSTERLQVLQRASARCIHFPLFSLYLWHHSFSHRQALPSPVGLVASSVAAGGVIKGLATTTLRKHLRLAASDEGLRQQQPGWDAEGWEDHFGLVSLEMLVGNCRNSISGYRFGIWNATLGCFGIVVWYSLVCSHCEKRLALLVSSPQWEHVGLKIYIPVWKLTQADAIQHHNCNGQINRCIWTIIILMGKQP